MDEIKNAFENGVPVDFRVSFSTVEVLKMVTVIIVLTIAVSLITLTIKNTFFK